MTACYFIQPHDVLFLRGNNLFGAAGSYGDSLMPPNPSVMAGAIRSALMAHKGIDFAEFARDDFENDEFGNAARPGSFRLTAFHLARRDRDGKEVEALYPLPADLSATKPEDSKVYEVRRLKPEPVRSLLTSAATDQLAVLSSGTRAKPETGLWLNTRGWQAYLRGETPDSGYLIRSDKLWKRKQRIGIGLDADRRSAAEGRLFTTEAVSLAKQEHGGKNGYDVGFLAQVEGVEPPQEDLTLRLGGDGRAAQASLVSKGDCMNEPDWEKISQDKRCRIILTTPGIFADGWLPTGTSNAEGKHFFALGGIRAALVCAAVPRNAVISGWDLAKKRPKPAQRVAPVGSVYWLQDLQATPEQLCKLAEGGLWPDEAHNDSRRIEGYNRFVFANF